MSKFLDVYLRQPKIIVMKKSLTKAEEQIMHALWSVGTGGVQDIMGLLEARPARTTVATLLSILENKGFVTRTLSGRQNIYRPALSKREYSKTQLQSLVKNYFDGSFGSMISFFAAENNISLEQLDEMISQTRKELEP